MARTEKVVNQCALAICHVEGGSGGTGNIHNRGASNNGYGGNGGGANGGDEGNGDPFNKHCGTNGGKAMP